MTATARTHQNLRLLTKVWLEQETDDSFQDAYGRGASAAAAASVAASESTTSVPSVSTVDSGSDGNNGGGGDSVALRTAMMRHHLTVAKLKGGMLPADVQRAIEAGVLPFDAAAAAACTAPVS